jgi:hypothetical protein
VIEERRVETDKLDWCIAFCKQFASVNQQDIPSEATAQLDALKAEIELLHAKLEQADNHAKYFEDKLSQPGRERA